MTAADFQKIAGNRRRQAAIERGVGSTYGILRAESFLRVEGKRHIWRFSCGCGASCDRAIANVRSSVRQGAVPNCGCLARGRASWNAVDIEGRRFGGLVVRAYAGTDARSGGIRWVCDCDCGRETVVRANLLRARQVKSCGCGRGSKEFYRNRADVSPGMKFGRLTVEFLVCVEAGREFFWCECECGGGATVRANQLTAGQTKSCGCLRSRPGARRGERERAYQTAGKTAPLLRQTPEFRLQLNGITPERRIIAGEAA